jgi:hypothetical protein
MFTAPLPQPRQAPAGRQLPLLLLLGCGPLGAESVGGDQADAAGGDHGGGPRPLFFFIII